jgi:hypothetical protein
MKERPPRLLLQQLSSSTGTCEKVFERYFNLCFYILIFECAFYNYYPFNMILNIL